MPIYCIGDSHSSFFAGLNEIQRVWPVKAKQILPFFKVFPIGQTLAYNLINTKSTSKGREKLFEILNQEIPKNEYVMLCFGEIDCRAHLLKQSRVQNKKIDVIVNECVDRYFSVILEIKKINPNVIIWNVVPSTRLEKIGNNLYPIVGSCKERNEITKLFNHTLHKKCQTNNIYYISIYDKLMDESGLTNTSYYMDEIHLSQKAMPITLKTINNRLKINLKLSLIELIKYKTINVFWDLFINARQFKRKVLKK